MLSLVRNLINPLIEGSPVVLQHSLDSNHPIIPLVISFRLTIGMIKWRLEHSLVVFDDYVLLLFTS